MPHFEVINWGKTACYPWYVDYVVNGRIIASGGGATFIETFSKCLEMAAQ